MIFLPPLHPSLTRRGRELFYFRDDLGEDFRLLSRELRENFTVEANLGGFELTHENAVAHPVFAGGSIDADLPDLAEFTLLQTAVLIGMSTSLGRGGFGFPDLILAAPFEPFGDLENIFSPLDVGDTSFDAHRSLGIGKKPFGVLFIRRMEAGIATLIHRHLAAIAGIKVILASFSLHQLLRAGHAKALGGCLVSLHFRHRVRGYKKVVPASRAGSKDPATSAG